MEEMELKEYLQIQCEEMKKHKWIESEKVGYDLGQMACLDWIKKYSSSFRKFWECTNASKQNNT